MKLVQSILATAASALLALPASANLSATSTYTSALVSPGEYQYDFTLNNTGTTTIGTYWLSWIPGAGFLSTAPSGTQSPSGWNPINTNGGHAVQWTTSSSLLAPGSSVTGFVIDTSETPAQLAGLFAGPGPGTGDPVTTTFVYIAAPLADPGEQIVATAASSGSPVPEPATLGLLAVGLAGAAFLRRRQAR